MKKTFAVPALACLALALLPLTSCQFQASGSTEGVQLASAASAGLNVNATGGALPQENIDAPVQELTYTSYRVKAGDNLGLIAKQFNLRTGTLITFNDIRRSRSLQIGSYLKIPNQDGVLLTLKDKDTLDSLAEKYEVQADDILKVNKIQAAQIVSGARIFLPGAQLQDATLREVNGDLFRWPAYGYISSRYGYRKDPFTGERSFHNGIDIAAPLGSTARAAMEGRVSQTGYANGLGNFITVNHAGGYVTVYGHLKAIWVEEGQRVGQGEGIGAVGNTGYSTGSHLHFTVQQWGRSLNPMYVLH